MFFPLDGSVLSTDKLVRDASDSLNFRKKKLAVDAERAHDSSDAPVAHFDRIASNVSLVRSLRTRVVYGPIGLNASQFSLLACAHVYSRADRTLAPRTASDDRVARRGRVTCARARAVTNAGAAM